MAAEAEAAREARAKVIAAEGEQKASRALREASEVIGDSPAALQLRYLQVYDKQLNYILIQIDLTDVASCIHVSRIKYESYWHRATAAYSLLQPQSQTALCRRTLLLT